MQLSLAEEAISLCQRTETIASLSLIYSMGMRCGCVSAFRVEIDERHALPFSSLNASAET